MRYINSERHVDFRLLDCLSDILHVWFKHLWSLWAQVLFLVA